jgi:hypothetical protein
MPPQGPPQGAPPQGPGGPPPGGQPPQGGGSPLGNLLTSLDKAIDSIASNIMGDKSAPPRAKQLIQSIDQQFGELLDMIQGGPDEESAGGAMGQTVPPEAGGNKGAVPSPM